MRSPIAPVRPVAVAMVIDTVTRGGAERVLITIANALDPARFRVHVITTREPGDFAAELAPHVLVHSLHRRTRWDVLALRRLVRLADAHDIRLMHTHSHSAAYFVRLARLAGGRRWLHVMHDHHGPVVSSLPLRLADRAMLRGVDHDFAVSDQLVRYAVESIGLPSARCERLDNGVVVSERAWDPGSRRFTVVHLARIAPEKGHDFAIAAAERLRTVIPDLRWVCIGSIEGAHARAIGERVRAADLSDTVEFLGERSDVQAVLRGGHVGVLTSRWEGLPMALLEYMAAGLPVVVTDVGDCGRVVRAAGGGTAVRPGDVDAFVAAIAAIAADPAAASAAGEQNRRHVLAHHSSAAMVRRVAEVYEALLAGRSAGGGALDQRVSSFSRATAPSSRG